jgi:hypothetical protein
VLPTGVIINTAASSSKLHRLRLTKLIIGYEGTGGGHDNYHETVPVPGKLDIADTFRKSSGSHRRRAGNTREGILLWASS